VGAAVRAVAIEKAPAVLRIPKEHEVLAQHAQRLERPLRHARIQPRVEFIHERHGLPVTAQHGAARRARTDAGDEGVLFCFHPARACFSCAAHTCTAVFASSRTRPMRMKPWTSRSKFTRLARLPAVDSACAYCRPSSRSG